MRLAPERSVSDSVVCGSRSGVVAASEPPTDDESTSRSESGERRRNRGAEHRSGPRHMEQGVVWFCGSANSGEALRTELVRFPACVTMVPWQVVYVAGMWLNLSPPCRTNEKRTRGRTCCHDQALLFILLKSDVIIIHAFGSPCSSRV